jgi:hypothetical protein
MMPCFNRYPADVGCTYTIEAGHDEIIRLNYTHLDVSNVGRCDGERCQMFCNDYIAISSTNGYPLKYCTTQEIEQNSMGNLVTIYFQSDDDSFQGTGFMITYEALSPDQI